MNITQDQKDKFYQAALQLSEKQSEDKKMNPASENSFLNAQSKAQEENK